MYALNQKMLDELSQGSQDAPSVPLVGEPTSMRELRAEYERGSPSFVQQIDWLVNRGYNKIRRTRGDGDCFYRSVAFGFAEGVQRAPERSLAVKKCLSILTATKSMLEKAGFESLVYEDPYGILTELVENVGIHDQNSQLLQTFQSIEVSNYIVFYMRLVASAQMRLDPDAFEAFLFNPETGEPMDVRRFCEHFVEASNKEADHVQMMALSRALQIDIDIAYLDGRGANGVVNFVEFRNATDTGTKPIVLLYRPGHYDILLGPTDN